MAGPGRSSGRNDDARSAARPGDAYGTRFDGRLDLDRLDEDSPLDLDVVGDDGPLLSERVGAWFEGSGITPFARRHPLATTVVAAASAVALIAGIGWWSSRPQPLADDAAVVVSTDGQEPVRVVVDPATGHATGLTQLVLVTSREAAEVEVDTIGIVGPGLVRPTARIPTAHEGAPSTGAVASDVDCSSADVTDAVVAASAGDYRVLVRRADAVTGEVRESTVALEGAEEWLREIRRACVQIAADRDLVVRSVAAAQVPGVVAADIRMLVRNTSDRPWRAVRVSTAGGPAVVGVSPPLDLAPGAQEWVTARLWPDDCTHPVAALSAGVPLRATLEEDVAITESRAPTFRVPIDTGLDAVASALSATCAGAAPTLAIERSRVAAGSLGGSAGTIDIWADLAVPDGLLVEVQEPLVDEAGVVQPLETPVAVEDGVAKLRLRWIVPECFDMLQAGPPAVTLRVVSDLPRPYRLELTGPSVQLNLTRLCGNTVGGVVR